MSVRGRTVHRLGAVLGVAAVGLTSVFVASAAHAAPQDFGNIDADRIGSLTVHKYLHQVGDVEGDISAPPAAGDFTDPVAGVVFTAYPLLQGGVPLDLSIATNWDGLESLSAGAACTAPAGFALGTGIPFDPTDAQGAATVALAVGAYQVCETEAPAQIVDRSAPFIVTIPTPFEDGWVYDVHAYPKNGAGEIVKTIQPQQDTGLGAVVRFPVTVPVPTSTDVWTGFAIRDTLDARLAPVAAADVAVTVAGAPLDPAYYTVTTAGQQVTMNLTAAGLAWLNQGPNAQAGSELTVTFAGTVVEVGDGTILNEAELWTNNPGFDPAVRPPLPSNEVETHWGSLEILKRASSTTGTEGLLAGAAFEVYNAVDPYAADCTTAVAAGGPISVDGATTFTSATGGLISIPGLFVSDSENPAIDALQRCYVLKETAAPAGYVLPSDPFTGVTVVTGETTTADNADIVNTQQGVPGLPLTGANGQLILITAGVGAAIVVIGLVLMKRRRELAAAE
ncbi:SpaH/EbpB family LPXTG-anchored major pilin [Microbacterium phyllosphaerae]|uniref:SpaH/EbpB family LPXTG-anchored major pilin n=1 Tax=Microbacterium phyllosphaerae TaxID=124798 RepID=UPI003D65249F